jgi:hypothetical protein
MYEADCTRLEASSGFLAVSLLARKFRPFPRCHTWEIWGRFINTWSSSTISQWGMSHCFWSTSRICGLTLFFRPRWREGITALRKSREHQAI